MHGLLRGLVAGAAGTVALNVATYADMLVRARPASTVPAKVAGKMAALAEVDLGEERDASNREQAGGALLGYVTGLGVGLLCGLLRGRSGHTPPWLAGPLLGAAAMAASDVSAAVFEVTDPTDWSAKSWAADIVPHLAYGTVTASVFNALR